MSIEDYALELGITSEEVITALKRWDIVILIKQIY